MSLPSLRRSTALAAAAGVALLGLTACSTGSSDADSAGESTANTTAEADAFPVTIATSFGDVTIEDEPEKVVTLGVDGENAVALGVAPIAIEKMSWGGNAEGRTDWFDEALAEIDGAEEPQLLDVTDGIPTAEIIALEPDVVIGTNSGLTQDDYDTLTDAGIDVVGYPGTQWATTWRQSIEMVGQALGRTQQAEEAAADVEEAMATAVEENPQVEGASFLWTFFYPTDLSKVSIYTETDNRPGILTELGMTNPAIVEEAGTETFFFDVSSERAAELEADVMIAYGNSAEEAEQLLATPLAQQIPPVANENYVISLEPNDTLGLSFPSVLGIPVALDAFLPKVAQAIDGTPQVN
ncbi:ABC transporter substrate-binding protein [Nocardioides sp. ChNu-99]|uniref:ABC transporter substrate-binding protein n=1 Tax=Nocardioides sp. ChNu-99 TaxID=2839897 RepID=UPI0024072EDB|nr:ABC transporter substrate-binding protein [Nocardioides sp. ChNu-99]MDF9715888.1 ABC transporter substrate-binding protein [Nocardioides sp. ChNu-99]